MSEHRYAFMRPQDIVAERRRAPVAYVPLGPLEWHGPLKNTEFGILDHPTCAGEPTPDFTVRREQDPRYATAEEGRAGMAVKTPYITERIRQALAAVAC